MENRISNNAVNLCDSCDNAYPECISKIENVEVMFGSGKGNDNICCCNGYIPGNSKQEHDFNQQEGPSTDTARLSKVLSLLVSHGDCPSQISLEDLEGRDTNDEGVCLEYSANTCKECWIKALDS